MNTRVLLVRRMELNWQQNIVRYLTNGEYPHEMNKQDKRNFRRKAKQFVVEKDTLFYVAGKSRLQVIVGEKKKASSLSRRFTTYTFLCDFYIMSFAESIVLIYDI